MLICWKNQLNGNRGINIPDITVFFRFWQHFNALNTNIMIMDIWNRVLNDQVTTKIEQWKADALMVLQPARGITTKKWLFTKFLGSPTSLHVRRSGASNKARWMGKLHVLYAFKICLLKPAVNELPSDTIASTQQIS